MSSRSCLVLRLAAVASLLTVGLLAGCAGGPEPSSSAGPEPSSSEPGAGVQVAPTRPAAWDEVDTNGAVAVATYFMQMYAYAYSTGDLAEWNTLSHPDCKFCSSTRRGVESLVASGQSREGGTAEISEESVSELAPGEVYAVDLVVVESPARVVDRQGGPVSDWSPEHVYSTNVVVVRDDEHWAIRGVRPVQTDERDRVDLQGAVSVAADFIELYGYAFTTGDVTEWTAMSHPECAFCADLRRAVETAAAQASHAEGADRGDLDVRFRDLRA